MKKALFLLTLSLSSAINIECAAQSDNQEILDYHIEAFNKRDIEKYLHHLHDSVTVTTFPAEITDKNIGDVRTTYTSAFNAKSLGGQIRIAGRRKFGDYYIQEESLEGFNTEPVMNYVMYRFKGNKIIEIVYLPGNWKPAR
jgi:hypothetical protein